MLAEFDSTLDQLQSMETRLGEIATALAANDAQFEQYPKALDAQVFYALSLRPLFNEKQELLREQRQLTEGMESLREAAIAKLDAEARKPESIAEARRQSEARERDRQRWHSQRQQRRRYP